jgi:hypothetical protein
LPAFRKLSFVGFIAVVTFPFFIFRTTHPLRRLKLIYNVHCPFKICIICDPHRRAVSVVMGTSPRAIHKNSPWTTASIPSLSRRPFSKWASVGFMAKYTLFTFYVFRIVQLPGMCYSRDRPHGAITSGPFLCQP